MGWGYVAAEKPVTAPTNVKVTRTSCRYSLKDESTILTATGTRPVLVENHNLLGRTNLQVERLERVESLICLATVCALRVSGSQMSLKYLISSNIAGVLS